MYAEETSTPGEFNVYGSTERSCPGQSVLVVPSGSPGIAKDSPDSDAVTQIQTFLKQYQSPAIAIDGDFGNQTRGFLIDWQNAQNLTVDGIWDPEDAAQAQAIIDADSGGDFACLALRLQAPTTRSASRSPTAIHPRLRRTRQSGCVREIGQLRTIAAASTY